MTRQQTLRLLLRPSGERDHPAPKQPFSPVSTGFARDDIAALKDRARQPLGILEKAAGS